jgi:hypothetical protein
MQKIGNDSDALLGRLADVVLVWLLLAMVPVEAVTAATTAFFLMPALMRRPWRSMAEYFRRMMVASHSLWSSQRASSLNRLPPWLQKAPDRRFRAPAVAFSGMVRRELMSMVWKAVVPGAEMEREYRKRNIARMCQ